MPLAAGIIAGIRLGSPKAPLCGALCFFVFQLATRIPLLSYLGAWSAPWMVFQRESPVLYILVLALSAGLFEELGRYVIMRGLMKGAGFADSVAFGIGHGGLEALALVGLSFMLSLVSAGTVYAAGIETILLWSGFERVFAMLAQIGFSVMVWRSLQLKKPLYLLLAIFLHAALDFTAPLLMTLGSPVCLTESVIAAFALLLLRYAFFIWKKDAAEKARLHSTKEVPIE